ncbi:MAG: cellulose biosynthesis cyclic di-GMP-binding regulatory protein BcsB [Gemmatimonadota bacterium]
MTWRRSVGYTTPGLLGLLLAVSACGRKDDTPAMATRAPLPATVDSAAAQAKPDSGTSGATREAMPTVTVRGVDTSTTPPMTLAAIGYRSGITLLGASDEATIAIPVNDGLHPAELQLLLMPTPNMPAATLVLRQRDHVLAVRALSDTTSRITLPLGDAIVVDGKATLSLVLSVPGRDACQAQLYYRTVVAPESRIAYTGIPSPVGGINSFFAPWLSKVTFYLADQPSLDAAQAALDASAFVARHYRGMATTFEIKPLPAGNTMPEPGPYERALVWSPTGTSMIARPEGGRGTVLALAARRDARQLFTLADGAALVTGTGFATTTANLSHNILDNGTDTHTLAELGFSSRTLEGSALLVTAYPFALADFGTSTAPTAFRLVARHSVLPPNGNGSVRVHLNGSLIYSRALDHTGLDVVVPLPAHVLGRDNVLEVRFQVVLGEGGCQLGGPVFTATIDDASAFVTNGRSTLPPGFGRFPAAFVPAFSVLLEPRDRFRVELAATVVGAMQQTTTTPLAPGVARDLASATGPLLAIGTTGLADALDAPVHSEGFRLRDREGKVWDEFMPNAPYAAMQGWERNGNDVLLLHHTHQNGQPLADLVREMLAPYGWFGVRGDLVVRGEAGPAHAVTIANAGYRLELTGEGTASRLARYRSAVFLVAAFLIMGLLLWLYPRVVRRELDSPR